MKVMSFNVLADAYTGYGDYSQAPEGLMRPGARMQPIVDLITKISPDVAGLQEVDEDLATALDNTNQWQVYWTQKGRNKPDGCLMLIKRGLLVADFESLEYGDDTGHVAQVLKIGGAAILNAHLKWDEPDSASHTGAKQAKELLDCADTPYRAVWLGDINDRPGGPVRTLIEDAGFSPLHGDMPTAIVNGQPVSLDVIAVRGMMAEALDKREDLPHIPSYECPSDHVPIVAEVHL